MLDVPDQRGVTARMLLAKRAGQTNGAPAGANAGGDRAPNAYAAIAPGSSPRVPAGVRIGDDGTEWSDRIKIGDTVTELRGSTVRDPSGRIRSIRVSAETLPIEPPALERGRPAGSAESISADENGETGSLADPAER
jgi:hypothetical protein